MSQFSYWAKEDVEALKEYADSYHSAYSVTHPKFWIEFSEQQFDGKRTANACRLKYLLISGRAAPQVNRKRNPVEERNSPKKACFSVSNRAIAIHDRTMEKVSKETQHSPKVYEVVVVDDNDKEEETEEIQSNATSPGYTVDLDEIKLYELMYKEIKRYGDQSGLPNAKRLLTNLDEVIGIIYKLNGDECENLSGFDNMMHILTLKNCVGRSATMVKLMEFNVLVCHKSLKYYKLKHGKKNLN